MISLGNIDIKKVSVGSGEIKKGSVGSVDVWSAEPEPLYQFKLNTSNYTWIWMNSNYERFVSLNITTGKYDFLFKWNNTVAKPTEIPVSYGMFLGSTSYVSQSMLVGVGSYIYKSQAFINSFNIKVGKSDANWLTNARIDGLNLELFIYPSGTL